MKKILCRVLSLALLAAMLMPAFCTAALAANVCSAVYGSTARSCTFTVKTDSGFILGQKITLTQSKGTAKGKWMYDDKYYSSWGLYRVTVERVSGSGKVPAEKTWYGRDCTLSLGKNTTYRITVTPLNNEMYTKHMFFLFYGWSRNATWSVKKTTHITLCQ